MELTQPQDSVTLATQLVSPAKMQPQATVNHVFQDSLFLTETPALTFVELVNTRVLMERPAITVPMDALDANQTLSALSAITLLFSKAEAANLNVMLDTLTTTPIVLSVLLDVLLALLLLAAPNVSQLTSWDQECVLQDAQVDNTSTTEPATTAQQHVVPAHQLMPATPVLAASS
jgi:hypothetical protein